MAFIMGVDPGIKGSIAILDEENNKVVALYDMPTLTITMSNGKKRKRLDLAGLAGILDSVCDEVSIAVVEEVGVMPKDGRLGAFTFGYTAGAIAGMIALCKIPMAYVKPSVWKSSLWLDSDKEKSIAMAKKLYPDCASLMKRKMDDGRAEAILLCHFYRNYVKKGLN